MIAGGHRGNFSNLKNDTITLSLPLAMTKGRFEANQPSMEGTPHTSDSGGGGVLLPSIEEVCV